VRVDLPSGNTVDLRDQIKGGDRIAAQKALKFRTGEDRVQVMEGDAGDQIAIALLIRMITGWSFEGRPVPSQQLDGNQASCLEDLDIDDYDALIQAVEPFIEKVTPRRPNAGARRA
jgi:hypothetical protein